jgi:Tol biopolymer transport system component
VQRAAGLFCSLLLIFSTAAAAAGPVELVSRIDPGQVSDSASGASTYAPDYESTDSVTQPALSADGRYLAFVSPSPNLVPGQRDANGDGPSGTDVFLRDLAAGTTTLVSHAAGSETTAGNSDSGYVGMALSADGRYVAYVSQATDLVPGQTVDPDRENLYLVLYDRAAGTNTVAVSTSDSTAQFSDLAISADGRYLTFTTNAEGILPGLPYSPWQRVYLYDRGAGKLRLVEHKRGLPNVPGDDGSSGLGISADGRYVLFASSSGGLAPGQRPDDSLFLYDRVADASVAVGPGPSSGFPFSSGVLLSADGKYVAVGTPTPYFWSRETGQTTLATGIASNQGITLGGLSADGRYALFQRRDSDNNFTLIVYDRVSRTSVQASRPSPGSFNQIGFTALSADGRYALFSDPAPNVVAGQKDSATFSWDVFLFDRVAQKTILVSHAAAAALTAANAPSLSPVMSANGSRIAFSSKATNLVAGVRDLNDGIDLFAYTVSTKTLEMVTRRAPALVPVTADARSAARALSADGRWVVFESASPRLITGQVDANGQPDLFLYDRVTRQTVLVSHADGSPVTTGNGSSQRPAISADGRWISFLSTASDLVAGAPFREGYASLYLFDRVTGTTRLVSLGAGVSNSNGEATGEQQISADGNWVAFTSLATDVVPGQHQNVSGYNLFLWSRETGNTVLITRSSLYADLWTAYGQSGSPAISADGRYVAFRSTANDLIPGQTADPTNTQDGNVFLYDRGTGAIALVSHQPSSPAAGSSADSPPSLSADGRFVAFCSSDSGLDPGEGGLDHSLYLYDRTLGTNQWIAYGFLPQVSADGGTVAFGSYYPLVPGVSSNTPQLYLWDRGTKAYTLATSSRRPGAVGSENGFLEFALSSNGRYLAFSSLAHDLVAGEVPPVLLGSTDVYLFDRVTGGTALVSRSKASALAATGASHLPLISADGHRVAFTSGSGLVDGDYNRQEDAYLFDLDASTPGGPVAVPPCVLFDGAAQRSNVRKVLTVTGSCGVPSDAARVTVKVTAREGTAAGNLRLYPGDVTAPPSGTLRFVKTQPASATFDLPLASNGAGTIAVLPFARGNGTVRVIVEVDGYTR